jgi:nucleotide-binding universal stress UspA family protein
MKMSHIVVGVDESAGAASALRWAARYGEAHGLSLTAVLAWGFLDQHHALAVEGFDPSYEETYALEALDAIVARTLGTARGASVERKVICDLAAPALLEASRGAGLLVVGARVLGGFKGTPARVGEPALPPARHRPVAIVRHEGEPGQGGFEHIVVGIAGSDTGRRALEWALGEGRVHHATVEVVHAWAFPYTFGEFVSPVDPAPLADAARLTLEETLASVDTSGLPGPVTRTVTSGEAATAIVLAAKAADLVVVGSRGLSHFERFALGSVSRRVVHHAPCPVVVVPPAAECQPHRW